MKEFIDKLKSRLEEEKIKDVCDDISCVVCHERYKTDSRDDCFQPVQMLAYDKAISIVNQLAEEYNKKQEHEVWLNGCDDDTIFTMEMTNREYEFLKRVSELANETSTYYCMPRLFLDEGVGYAPPYTEGEL